jgi:hypothetical protein
MCAARAALAEKFQPCASAFRNKIKNVPLVKLATSKLINLRILIAEVTYNIVAHIMCS